MSNNVALQQLVDRAVSLVLEEVSQQTVLSQKIPKPWEMVHRYGDYGKALALSVLTNSPTDIHLQFTEQAQKIIHIALQDFNTREVAAGLAMIEPKVFDTWMRLGSLGYSPYYQFMLEVRRSEAMAEAADNNAISRGNAFAKIERLKRRSKAWEEVKAPTVNIDNHVENTINNSPLMNFKTEERKRIIEEMLLGIDIDNGNVVDVD